MCRVSGYRKGKSYVPTYIALVNWTDQGVKNIKDTIERADSARELAPKLLNGGTLQLYWALGPYDLVAILEGNFDEKNVAAFVLEVASGGSIRTTTMRVYEQREMFEIIEKLP